MSYLHMLSCHLCVTLNVISMYPNKSCHIYGFSLATHVISVHPHLLYPCIPPSPCRVNINIFVYSPRAAQKLGKKKKRQQSIEQDQAPPRPSFPTSYSDVIRLTPPPAPPCLLRTVGRLQNPGMGKVSGPILYSPRTQAFD